MIDLSLSPRTLWRAQLGAIAGLHLLNALAQAPRLLGAPDWPRLRRLFDVDGEGNLPSWYSSVALLACAALLGLIASTKARERDRFWKHWALLSLTFVGLSADETAQVHEALAAEMLRHLAPPFIWCTGGLLLAAGFSLFGAFVRHLPPGFRARFVVSFSLFVAGGFIVEAVAQAHARHAGWDNLTYVALTAVEEMLEMVSVALFASTLVDYAREQGAAAVSMRLESPVNLRPP